MTTDTPDTPDTPPPPRLLWLQWQPEEDAGIGEGRPDGPTFTIDVRAYRDDVAYIRAGKRTAGALGAQDGEIARLRARVAALEAENAALHADILAILPIAVTSWQPLPPKEPQ